MQGMIEEIEEQAIEEYETISGEDAKRLLAGKKMVDCYNVTELKKTEDDKYDEKLYSSRNLSTEEKEEFFEKQEYLKIDQNDQSNQNDQNQQKESFNNQIVQRMLQKRLDEEKQIFEILLREDMEKEKEKEREKKKKK